MAASEQFRRQAALLVRALPLLATETCFALKGGTAGLITQTTLISRFETELEPHITGRTSTWNRTTLKMWVDACWPHSH